MTQILLREQPDQASVKRDKADAEAHLAKDLVHHLGRELRVDGEGRLVRVSCSSTAYSFRSQRTANRRIHTLAPMTTTTTTHPPSPLDTRPNPTMTTLRRPLLSRGRGEHTRRHPPARGRGLSKVELVRAARRGMDCIWKFAKVHGCREHIPPLESVRLLHARSLASL